MLVLILLLLLLLLLLSPSLSLKKAPAEGLSERMHQQKLSFFNAIFILTKLSTRAFFFSSFPFLLSPTTTYQSTWDHHLPIYMLGWPRSADHAWLTVSSAKAIDHFGETTLSHAKGEVISFPLAHAFLSSYSYLALKRSFLRFLSRPSPSPLLYNLHATATYCFPFLSSLLPHLFFLLILFVIFSPSSYSTFSSFSF